MFKIASDFIRNRFFYLKTNKQQAGHIKIATQTEPPHNLLSEARDKSNSDLPRLETEPWFHRNVSWIPAEFSWPLCVTYFCLSQQSKPNDKHHAHCIHTEFLSPAKASSVTIKRMLNSYTSAQCYLNSSLGILPHTIFWASTVTRPFGLYINVQPHHKSSSRKPWNMWWVITRIKYGTGDFRHSRHQIVWGC